jgi:hypothetical protein
VKDATDASKESIRFRVVFILYNGCLWIGVYVLSLECTELM